MIWLLSLYYVTGTCEQDVSVAEAEVYFRSDKTTGSYSDTYPRDVSQSCQTHGKTGLSGNVTRPQAPTVIHILEVLVRVGRHSAKLAYQVTSQDLRLLQ